MRYRISFRVTYKTIFADQSNGLELDFFVWFEKLRNYDYNTAAAAHVIFVCFSSDRVATYVRTPNEKPFSTERVFKRFLCSLMLFLLSPSTKARRRRRRPAVYLGIFVHNDGGRGKKKRKCRIDDDKKTHFRGKTARPLLLVRLLLAEGRGGF